MPKKDYRAQLTIANEENLRLSLELIQLKESTEEKIKQARADERVSIAGEILVRRREE